MYKKVVSIYITEYAKIKLTERANALGLNLSSYLEYLSRTGDKNGKEDPYHEEKTRKQK